MSSQRPVAMFMAAYIGAAAAFWAVVVAVGGVDSFYSVALSAVFSMLTVRIFARRWPVAGIPWTPWRTWRPADMADAEDPEVSLRLRILNIGFLIATGVMVLAVVSNIIRSVTGTSP